MQAIYNFIINLFKSIYKKKRFIDSHKISCYGARVVMGGKSVDFDPTPTIIKDAGISDLTSAYKDYTCTIEGTIQSIGGFGESIKLFLPRKPKNRKRVMHLAYNHVNPLVRKKNIKRLEKV